eukprot:TRINITY_DN61219_c0_g1_i1.p1 TRINITY_DN61219_c0_g1~~TRINITY_DN61219_c0_g1_i1.p1  ORF type:complete len:277 (+),score=109.92 TRINITY_DN61219_c0_g1_i1:64-831(+)
MAGAAPQPRDGPGKTSQGCFLVRLEGDEARAAEEYKSRQLRVMERVLQRQRQQETYYKQLEVRDAEAVARWGALRAAQAAQDAEERDRQLEEHSEERGRLERREEELRLDLWEEEMLEITIMGQEHRLLLQKNEVDAVWERVQMDRKYRQREEDSEATAQLGHRRARDAFERTEMQERAALAKAEATGWKRLSADAAAGATAADAAAKRREDEEARAKEEHARRTLEESRGREVREAEDALSAVCQRLEQRARQQ